MEAAKYLGAGALFRRYRIVGMGVSVGAHRIEVAIVLALMWRSRVPYTLKAAALAAGTLLTTPISTCTTWWCWQFRSHSWFASGSRVRLPRPTSCHGAWRRRHADWNFHFHRRASRARRHADRWRSRFAPRQLVVARAGALDAADSRAASPPRDNDAPAALTEAGSPLIQILVIKSVSGANVQHRSLVGVNALPAASDGRTSSPQASPASAAPRRYRNA